MPYSIEIAPAARRSLARISLVNRRRIDDVVLGLASNPRPPGCVKLSGELDLWRCRVGVYRIVYRIQDQQLVILVVRIGHRRDVYK